MSVAACLASPDVSPEALSAAVTDLMTALGELNVELNGPVPSDELAGSEAVPRSTAYAVAEIGRILRDAEDRNAVPNSWASWHLDTAWLAVLAGDIDDLDAHLANEETMRPA
jgi:hypothetical protein